MGNVLQEEDKIIDVNEGNKDVRIGMNEGNADVRIVHISDTHNRHDEITKDLLEAGEADILIHTGDFSDSGTDEEFANFNRWLGEVKARFPRGVYVILGNHDFKFLDGLCQTEEFIAIMASDEERRKYIQDKLPNAVVLDNELRKVTVGANNELTLTIFASPWNPFQSSPTYPDRVIVNSKVKTDHHRVFQRWSESLPEERKKKWIQGEAWRYDEIPTDGTVDILLTHVPPFGVFDQQPFFTNWGSSQPLRYTLLVTKPRMHLFGHVHAQRGYWEKVDTYTSMHSDSDSEEVDKVEGICNEEDKSEITKKMKKTSIIGGVQYATTTNEEVKYELMEGNEESGIQFMANSALMTDRTVQPFAKKKIVGKPRLICGTWIPKGATETVGGAGEWHFHGMGGGPKF